MPALTIRPADGGQLITRAASSDAGVPHYTVKRNIRRDLSDDIRREGHDYFNPIPTAEDSQDFPYPGPNGEPLRLIHVARRPNGEAAVIAGTKTTLWRFNLDLGSYVDDGYVDDGYFEEATRWEIIASGLSANGRRWEAVDIDGTTIFNNGDDLPLAYRVEWRFARPLYEMRELGMVSFGTIAETNGLLVGGDVTELREQDRDEVLNVIRSGTIKVSQAGFQSSGSIYATTVDGINLISSAPVFSAFDQGRTLVWSNNQKQKILTYVDPTHLTLEAGSSVPLGLTFYITDTSASLELHATNNFFTAEMVGRNVAWADGTVRRIASVISPTVAMTDVDVPVAAGEAFVENPITYLSKTALEAHWLAKATPITLSFDRRQYRVVWGEEGQPTRHGVAVPCEFVQDSFVMRTNRMNKSIEQYEEIAVIGAGVSQGTLLTTLAGTGPGILVMGNSSLQTGSGSMFRKSAVGSVAGYSDLQDEGAGILKMLVLQTRLVVYSDGNIFLGRYTGEATQPFEFEIIKVPHDRGLHFRNTLLSIRNTAHFYAGRNCFYSFDLTSRNPEPIQSFDLVSNNFFDYARLDDTDDIFAADNKVTQEFFIVCPANTTDPVLAYDYVYQTISTVDFSMSAAATVKAVTESLVAETDDWFLMGTTAGTLLQYGLATKTNSAWNAKEIYYRRNARPYSATKQSYTSKFASGLIHFGDAYNEKHLTSYVLQLSSLQGVSPNLTVAFYTALNESGPQTLFGTTYITDVDNHGLIPMHCTAHHVRDEVYTDIQYPVRFHSRTWDFQTIKSKSYHKR